MRRFLAIAAPGAGLMLAALVAGPALADINVILDQAKVVRMPKEASTVVIGNPLVADITLQRAAGIMIVTGKSYGSTNMIMLDATGETLSEQQVVVRAGTNRIVTVQRGLKRESLTCQPVCEQTIVVGDDPESFAGVADQMSKHAGLATEQAGRAAETQSGMAAPGASSGSPVQGGPVAPVQTPR